MPEDESLATYPGIFTVLAALFRSPVCEVSHLRTVVEALADDLETSKNSISSEFAPLVLHLLLASGRQHQISGRAYELLQSFARNAAARSIAREYVMSLLADRCEQNNVNAVLLKGAAMDSAIYPRDAFRLGCDVDLLVPKQDYSRMEDVLKGLANKHEKTPGRPAVTAFAVEKTFKVSHPVHVQLDVHREVTVPYVYPIPIIDFHLRCLTHPGGPGKFLRLSDEDNLLQFAMHSFYDLTMFSKQTVDAFVLIKQGKISWPTLLSRAKAYRVIQPLKILLEGVSEVFQYVPAGEVAEEFKLRGIRKWLAYRLLIGEGRMSRFPGVGFRVRQLTSQFLLSGNIRGWLKYYFHYASAKFRDLVQAKI